MKGFITVYNMHINLKERVNIAHIVRFRKNHHEEPHTALYFGTGEHAIKVKESVEEIEKLIEEAQ
jgi:hypothetical protein